MPHSPEVVARRGVGTEKNRALGASIPGPEHLLGDESPGKGWRRVAPCVAGLHPRASIYMGGGGGRSTPSRPLEAVRGEVGPS